MSQKTSIANFTYVKINYLCIVHISCYYKGKNIIIYNIVKYAKVTYLFVTFPQLNAQSTLMTFGIEI